MAHQQLQFAETIRAMKLAMKRRASDDGGEDDAAARVHTNRGNKMKRGARHVQRDRLDDTGGLAYRKTFNHAGYTRATISANPPLVDEDGDLFFPESDDDDEAALFAEPVEDDPFADVRLDLLLRPLTSPAELPEHPSLSVPYKSKALTQMAEEALEMLRRERASLWKAKRLLQRFRGDADWVPCGTFEVDGDEALLNGEDEQQNPGNGLAAELSASEPESLPLDLFGENVAQGAPNAESDAMQGVEAVDMQTASGNDTDMHGVEERDTSGKGADESGGLKGQQSTAIIEGIAQQELDGHDPPANPTISDLAEREVASETASNSNGTNNTHAMTTRARARSPAERSDRTPSPSPSDSASVPPVHPWFLPPSSCLIDRDLGLPASEAEDTRKLLLLYVQKQEQVVRSLDALYSGLQKADRLRALVYRGCKAEAHLVPDGKGNMVTEMSDGEDWYDVADWNLQSWELKDGRLEKGKDEVEDVEEEGRRRPGRGRRVNRM